MSQQTQLSAIDNLCSQLLAYGSDPEFVVWCERDPSGFLFYAEWDNDKSLASVRLGERSGIVSASGKSMEGCLAALLKLVIDWSIAQ